jgi:hypothetical protein
MDKTGLRCRMSREIFEAIPPDLCPGGMNNPMSLSELLAEIRPHHPGVTAEDVLADAIGFEISDDRIATVQFNF